MRNRLIVDNYALSRSPGQPGNKPKSVRLSATVTINESTSSRVPGYVWLRLEHQSEPDRWMALRVLD
jgi:hypothetical protein